MIYVRAKKIVIMAVRTLNPVGLRTASCKCVNEVKRTIEGLAMTPQQIAEMAQRGVPISPQNMQGYYDGMAGDNNWRVEPMFRRGADINQLWEMEQTARQRILSARKKEIIKYR